MKRGRLNKKVKTKLLTGVFYGAIGFAASLFLSLIFYWSLSLNSSIYSLINNTKNEPVYLWSYILLTLGIIILFGVNASLFIFRWRKFGLPKIKTQTSNLEYAEARPHRLHYFWEEVRKW